MLPYHMQSAPASRPAPALNVAQAFLPVRDCRPFTHQPARRSDGCLCRCSGRLPRRAPLSAPLALPVFPEFHYLITSLLRLFSYLEWNLSLPEKYCLTPTESISSTKHPRGGLCKSVTPTHAPNLGRCARNPHKKDNLCLANPTPQPNANTTPKTANAAKCPQPHQ